MMRSGIMNAKQPLCAVRLGKAALVLGARQAGDDTGLTLASLGLVLAGLRRGPQPVRLPELADLERLIPAEHRRHAPAILAAARDIVAGLAADHDTELAGLRPSGSA